MGMWLCVFAASCFTYHCCVPGTTVAFWMICIGTMCNERSDLMVPVRSQVLSPCVYVAEEKSLIEGMKGRLLLRKGKVWNVMRVHECDHFESFEQVMMMDTTTTGDDDTASSLWSSIGRVLREIEQRENQDEKSAS